MTKYTVAILVRNKFGVLNRVTSMFRRRQFNIAALAVSETESAAFSRITIIFESEENKKKQLISQLYKLPDVCSIKELSSENSVHCELMLIKMENTPENREDIRAAAEAFQAETLDYSRDAMMFRIIGDGKRLDDFITLMRDYTILEICRTGTASLEKGHETLRQVTNL